MAQMKRGMWNTIKAGKSGTKISKLLKAPVMFRPMNNRTVMLESVEERKDRLVG
jgi:hypothetical protein